MTAAKKIIHVRRQLWYWYRQNKRDLLWRRTRDPYKILVSEVMLQQTQVDRVIPKYRAWLKAFPTIQSLARAPLHKVLRLWSGLGYNSRALRLRDTARIVVEKYHGVMPQTRDELQALPGVGEYTAGAVMTFAFRKSVGVIDTNVRRVTNRVWFGTSGASNEKNLVEAVDRVVPKKNADLWNHALMDLGATVCTSRRPKCEICPLQTLCRAYPAILRPPKIKLQSRPAFTSTDRYWRGQIINVLARRRQMPKMVLLVWLRQSGTLRADRYARLLRALSSSGLLEQRGPSVRIAQ